MKIIWILIGILMLSSVVYSDSNFVSPETINLNMGEGEKAQYQLIIKNLENYSILYGFELNDNLGDIIELREDSIYLGPKRSYEITLNFKIPLDAGNSELKTYLLINSHSYENEDLIVPINIKIDDSMSNKFVGYVVASSNPQKFESMFTFGLLAFLIIVGIFSYFYWMKKFI